MLRGVTILLKFTLSVINEGLLDSILKQTTFHYYLGKASTKSFLTSVCYRSCNKIVFFNSVNL